MRSSLSKTKNNFMASTVLEIIIQAKNEASKEMQNISKQAAEIGKTAGIMGGAIVGALGFAVKAAAEAEEKMASVHATLAAMGKDTPEVANAIQKAADATLKLGFDNEEAAQSITKLFQATGDLSKATKLNALAMDISAAKNISLEQANGLVLKAVAGSGKELKALGITLKDNATATEILTELEKTYAGQADARSKTFKGAMLVLKQQSGELMETIGAQLLPILSQLLQKVTPFIEKIIAWTEANPELTQKIVLVVAALGALLTVIGAIGVVIGPLTAAFTLLSGPVGIIIAMIALTVLYFRNLIAIFDLWREHSAEIVEGVKLYWQEFVTFLKTNVLDPITNYFKDVWSGLKIMAKEAIESILSFFEPLLNAVEKVSNGVSSAYNSVKGGVKSAVKSVTNFVTGKAGGGSVMANSPYMVGENGPELFTPSLSGSISPNGSLGGGSQYVVNINGGTYLSESVAKEIGDMIIQQFRRQARI
jgi:hypothetical protein